MVVSVRVVVALVSVIALLAVACSAERNEGEMVLSGDGRGSTTTSGGVDPREPSRAGLLLPTTTTVLSSDGRFERRVHPGSWRLIGLADGGRTLRVQVGFGGCTSFEGFEVAESVEAVQLLAVMETTILPPFEEQEEPFVACTDELRLPIEEVRLAEPLGERRLLGECRGDRPTCDTFGPRPPER